MEADAVAVRALYGAVRSRKPEVRAYGKMPPVIWRGLGSLRWRCAGRIAVCWLISGDGVCDHGSWSNPRSKRVGAEGVRIVRRHCARLSTAWSSCAEQVQAQSEGREYRHVYKFLA